MFVSGCSCENIYTGECALACTCVSVCGWEREIIANSSNQHHYVVTTALEHLIISNCSKSSFKNSYPIFLLKHVYSLERQDLSIDMSI